MITQTARKHLIAAIRTALRISYRRADKILNRNWMMLGREDGYRNAFVTVSYEDWTSDDAHLMVYIDGAFKLSLAISSDDLATWKTLSFEEAYPAVPGLKDPELKLTKVVGTLRDIRDAPGAPGVLLLNIDPIDGEPLVLTLIPLSWHSGNQLRDYAQSYYHKLQTFYVCPAVDATACMDGVPEGISPEALVAEFIMEPPFHLLQFDMAA